jgi:hypothetical protein
MEKDSSFYLQEVAGSDSLADGSDDDLFDSKQALDKSALATAVGATPQRSSFLRSPPTSRQKMASPSPKLKNRGPMSPFSPLTKPERGRLDATVSFHSNNDVDLSLTTCRKVSVLVTVHAPENNENNEKPSKLCLFPLVLETPSNPKGLLSPISATIRQAAHESTKDLVVVNPSAFGKHIPGHVTLETAKLVAQVVRTYPVILVLNFECLR